MAHSEWSNIYYEKLRDLKTSVEELRQLKETRIKQIAQIESKRRQVAVFGGAAIHGTGRGNRTVVA